MNPELEWLLKKKWYSQNAPARPFFTMVPGLDFMKRSHGFSYQTVFLLIRKDYGNFEYLEEDIESIGKRIEKILLQNPNYLSEKRLVYNKEMNAFEKKYEKYFGDCSGESDIELVNGIHELGREIGLTVGTAHCIESIGPRVESNLRHRLLKKTSGKTLNEDFSILSAPVCRSWTSEEAELLLKIKNSAQNKKEKLAERFIKDFFWSKTSYVGSEHWTVSSVLKAAQQAQGLQKPDFKSLKKRKTEIIEKYGLSETEKKGIEWIEFLTDWQDERKKWIQKGIFGLDTLVRELGKRYKIQPQFLEYLLPNEITLQALQTKTAEKKGKKRVAGCLIVLTPTHKRIFDGQKIIHKFERHLQEKPSAIELLNGQCASLGTATGPVKVCTTLDSLSNVQAGDILVASMTRPEYVSAMRKAAAVVTDEGGITCHAAIVSRELGIPCVIGTKNATRVLKDGWIVQVKASHGQVVVLEKRDFS